ncbi:MAG: HlyD family efflux transporter periplasmic adaptor subunit [Pseudomonadales bacterium]|nr:HlyD family efflux transporter periplasmic adaptor subunit [Pseudomonadales bacterium]
MNMETINGGYVDSYAQRKSGWLSAPLLMLAGLAGFVGWAAYFEIDQSVRTSGQIIPSDRTQIIQAVDGGVLDSLLVREGQQVEAGQVLATLERQRANASFEESRTRVAALQAALARARAEVLNAAPEFGVELEAYPEFISVQRSLYLQKQSGHADELGTLQRSLDMAEDELDMNEALLATGDASKLEVMRATREVNEIRGKISNVRNAFLQASYEEITELEADLEGAQHKLDERQSVLSHTGIVAPVDGVVKYLKLNTLGGVLRAGDELMQISPSKSELVLEAKVNPVDIGQLSLGIPVSIKLDAFDYSIYGSVEGELSYLSSDTLAEESGDQSTTYYRAQITVDENFSESNPKFAGISLRPGMTATVDIKTSKRSVLHYLTKPITRAFGGALNER